MISSPVSRSWLLPTNCSGSTDWVVALIVYAPCGADHISFAPRGAEQDDRPFCTVWGRIKVVAPHGASIRMPETDSNSVPRTPEEPTPQQVLEEMDRCEPYIVSDLVDAFPDASRWTVQRS